jgi:hypothetical protein
MEEGVMQDGDRGSDQRRAQEDEYFRRRDQELMDQVRRQSEVEHERRLIGEAIGVSDAQILVELQLAGYRANTIVLLELAPLLQIAWADGSVLADERDVIVQIAARERVVCDSPAHIKLQVSLERRPPEDFFDTSLHAIRAMLCGLQPDVQKTLRRRLLDNCTAVAVASGGLFGRRKIADEEHLILEHITTALECG